MSADVSTTSSPVTSSASPTHDAPYAPIEGQQGAPKFTTHAHQGPVVVFNIGMRILKPHRPDLWGPIARAMPRMLRELTIARKAFLAGEGEDPGFLGAEMMVGRMGPWSVQYWRDAASLHAYAADREGAHRPAWVAFNRAARSASTGAAIWHETFVVPEHGIETLYAPGADLGLGRVGGVVPVSRRGRRAADRLGGALRAE